MAGFQNVSQLQQRPRKRRLGLSQLSEAVRLQGAAAEPAVAESLAAHIRCLIGNPVPQNKTHACEERWSFLHVSRGCYTQSAETQFDLKKRSGNETKDKQRRRRTVCECLRHFHESLTKSFDSTTGGVAQGCFAGQGREAQSDADEIYSKESSEENSILISFHFIIFHLDL